MKIAQSRPVFYILGLAILLASSCGPARFERKYILDVPTNKNWNGKDIPWLPQQKSNQFEDLFAEAPNFASNLNKEKPNGLSQNNIISEKDIIVNVIASMPYSMPFYCDPLCYEPSIILSITACQPYLFALYYFAMYPPPYSDDDMVIYNGRYYRPRFMNDDDYCRGR